MVDQISQLTSLTVRFVFGTTAYRRRHPASVISPPIFSFSGRLTSRIGSTLLEAFPHLSHLWSLCTCPPKTSCTTHIHDILVLPYALLCSWFSAEMKNSCASCCAYPASSEEAFQVVARRLAGPNAGEFPE